ncbi:variable surface protein [Plasmodium gonderi]|uniref:Variable surface protein n=1 Tax=Plasmodium gonderi TaxID=77519 RepID=A0A1Y1JNR8_PLAGO|nr:variable surface protein [Plasmodium gonderi]GAW84236.1 variable surface protein [Plasmodium gonderi]
MQSTSNFDFMNIFPQCRYDYNGALYRRMRRQWLAPCSAVCSDYTNELQFNNSTAFHNKCHQLCLYLLDIYATKSDLTQRLEASCKYFYYKLKELRKNFGGKCTTTINCYEQMRKKYTPSRMDVPGVCVKYLENINNNDESIFTQFEYLQKLYDIENEFNKSKEELDKVNVKYEKYLQIKSECLPSPEQSYSSSEAGSGTVTGMCVSTTAILIIIFIFFKVKNNFNLLNIY